MYRTEVGYAGGSTPAPTYRSIGDHAEAVQIHFDPTELELDALLEVFWSGHDPGVARRSQYRAALFCESEAQLAAARESAVRVQARLGRPVATPIALRVPFYPAEAYHQKYRLRRNKALFDELQRHFDSEPTLLASFAAAKLNSYMGHHATRAQVDRALEHTGFQPDSRARLERLL